VVAALTRLFDWFWLRSAERAVRAGAGVMSPRALELTGRAALANEAALRTERPPEPFTYPGSDAVAAELYRESIHWALLAHAALRGEGAGEESGGAVPEQPTPIVELLASTDRELLLRAAGGERGLERLKLELPRSYYEVSELDPGAQRQLVEQLQRTAQSLLEPLAGAQRQLERIWVRRVLHVLSVLVVVGCVVLGIRQLSLLSQRRNDLSARATWTTSSRYPQGGCESPRQECPGGENYFFHTGQETDPWVMFDLGKERHISAVEIDNRLDCCTERAVPLAVAVSTDKRSWREVARRTTEFTNWRESFDSVRVRYVKIHVPQPSAILHLSRVRIYP
jgi:F5/8 type C domain